MRTRSLPTIGEAREYQVLTEADGWAAVNPALLRRLWAAADLAAVRRLHENVPAELPFEVLIGADVVSLWLDDQRVAVVSRGGWRAPHDL